MRPGNTIAYPRDATPAYQHPAFSYSEKIMVSGATRHPKHSDQNRNRDRNEFCKFVDS